MIGATSQCIIPGIDSDGNVDFANGVTGTSNFVLNKNQTLFTCESDENVVPNASGDPATQITSCTVVPQQGDCAGVTFTDDNCLVFVSKNGKRAFVKLTTPNGDCSQGQGGDGDSFSCSSSSTFSSVVEGT